MARRAREPLASGLSLPPFDGETGRLNVLVEHFFVSYNAAKGKKFEPDGRAGPRVARRLVDAGERRARKESGKGRRSSKKAS